VFDKGECSVGVYANISCGFSNLVKLKGSGFSLFNTQLREAIRKFLILPHLYRICLVDKASKTVTVVENNNHF